MPTGAQREAELIQQGIDPAMAAKMAEVAVLRGELDAGQSAINDMGKDYGTQTQGKYGRYVANPAMNAMAGYRGMKGALDQPGLFQKGKDAAADWGNALTRNSRMGAGENLGLDTPAMSGGNVQGSQMPNIQNLDPEMQKQLMEWARAGVR